MFRGCVWVQLVSGISLSYQEGTNASQRPMYSSLLHFLVAGGVWGEGEGESAALVRGGLYSALQG